MFQFNEDGLIRVFKHFVDTGGHYRSTALCSRKGGGNASHDIVRGPPDVLAHVTPYSS